MNPEELEAAQAQGAAMSLHEAVAYVSRGRRGRPQTRLGPSGLTATEEEVAVLAAQGLTNVDIAERMVMSRETVKSHLARVFAKLGLSSRRQLGESVQNLSKHHPERRGSARGGDATAHRLG